MRSCALVLGAFICLCLGSLVISVWHHTGPKGMAYIVFLGRRERELFFWLSRWLFSASPGSSRIYSAPCSFYWGAFRPVVLCCLGTKNRRPASGSKIRRANGRAEAAVLIFVIVSSAPGE